MKQSRLNQNQPLKVKKPLKANKGLRQAAPLITTTTKSKPKKPKLPSVAKLKKEADKYHSLATRLRFAEQRNGEWVAQCVTCTTPEWKPIKVLQCGHFMSRQFNSTRYSEENTAPQCYGCNIMQQGKQYAFGIWVDGYYGIGTAQRLYEESKVPHQFTRDELLDIIADSKKVIDFYTNNVLQSKQAKE